MAERRTLPVLPLRGTVIFPGITVPIGVGRPATLRAIETALKGDHLIFTVAQRENVDEPAPEQLYTMGVIGRIGQVQRGLGGVQLLLQGESPRHRPALSQHRRFSDGRHSADRGDEADQRERSRLRRPLQGNPRAGQGAGRAERPARGGAAPDSGLGHRPGPVRRPGRRLR